MVYETPEIQPEEQVALERIEELRKQLRFYVAEPRRWVGSVRRVLGAEAIRGSNSIEGFNVSVEDALAAMEGFEPTEAPWRDWQAILGYRRAMTYVLQLARDEHFELSPGLIKSLHFMMTEYDLEAGPGLWRPGFVYVRNDATGEVVYEGPDKDAVPGLIDELIDAMANSEDCPPMVRGAMAHLKSCDDPSVSGRERSYGPLPSNADVGERANPVAGVDEHRGVSRREYAELLRDSGCRWDAAPGNPRAMLGHGFGIA